MMRSYAARWLVAGVLAGAIAAPAVLTSQGAVRIFGTNNSGQAIAVQVAADGSLKLTLAVSGYEFEGATDDAFETTLAVVDPTADRTITFQNASGTVMAWTAAGVSILDDGDGAITFLGLGNGSDEDLTLNLDDTANTGVFTSSTALDTLNFSAIALQESGIGVLNADEIDASSELLAIMDDETGTGALTFATAPTFTTSIAIGAAGVVLSDDGDGALTMLGAGNGTDENLIINLDDTPDTATITSSTGLATVNFSSIALQESGIAVLNNDEIDASSELAAIMDDETGTGLLVFGTAPTFTTSTAVASTSNAASVNTTFVTASVTCNSGTASCTATNLIPAGATVVAVTARVTTVLAGAGLTTWSLGDGTTTDLWATGKALAQGTTVAATDHKSTWNVKYFSAANNVVLTAAAGQFDSGVIRITVFYLSSTAPTS